VPALIPPRKLCLPSSLLILPWPGKHSVMPGLDAGDYAQNSAPEVLTSPGPHPPTCTPDTFNQPGLPLVFTPPCAFLPPQLQPRSPQMHLCVCIPLLAGQPLCPCGCFSKSHRMVCVGRGLERSPSPTPLQQAGTIVNLKQGRKTGRCQILYLSPHINVEGSKVLAGCLLWKQMPVQREELTALSLRR